MKISGIIAEYNPFHNGHAFQIEATRQAGADAIVAVVGGNFTQRGDVSIMPKLSKAKAASLCGADLVVELPTVYSLGAAKDFATGAVRILCALGCVESLSFGSECENIDRLIKTAHTVSELESSDGLKESLSSGIGFAGAREAMLRNAGYDREADIIKSPNNILAIEYITALENEGSDIKPECVLRKGAGHNDIKAKASYEGANSDGICSASLLREIIFEDISKAANYMPESAYTVLCNDAKAGRAPIRLQKLEQAVLSRLRMLTPLEIKNINGISEGLENRIVYAIRNSSTLDELIRTATSKRYTSARIRRILLCSVLGITAYLARQRPAYIRVLAAGSKGFEILKAAKSSSSLPIISRTGGISSISASAAKFSSIEGTAYDLYSLAFDPPGKCGLEFTETNFI